MDRARWGLVLGSKRYMERIRKTIKVEREHKGRGIMKRRLSIEENNEKNGEDQRGVVGCLQGPDRG